MQMREKESAAAAAILEHRMKLSSFFGISSYHRDISALIFAIV
jgi:hypothetical protein